VRWNLKEVGGKALLRGTRITLEAGIEDKLAKQSEVQLLPEINISKCGEEME